MIDTRRAVADLKTIESIAIMTRVSSTNSVAQRIVTECVANDLSLPQAMILAEEQYAGRGRNQRTWSSPAGKGIYATTLLTRSARDLPLIPLEMANIIASFLRERFGIDARLKWPNDVLANGRKIAGILIEARVQEDRAFARDRVLGDWRSLTVHSPGDRITSIVNDRSITGTWSGIDDEGRALINDGSVTLAISAGELILA